jgi:hypothetical protein
VKEWRERRDCLEKKRWWWGWVGGVCTCILSFHFLFLFLLLLLRLRLPYLRNSLHNIYWQYLQ